MASLFGKHRLKALAENISTEEIQGHIDLIQTWHKDYKDGTLKTDKETSREQAYNQDFFIKILGYKEKPSNPYSLEPKATTEKGQLPDAVLSYSDPEQDIKNIAAVVELKGASVDLDRPQRREGNFSPVQQGFKYKSQYRNCPFVVVSNFWEFRLYRDNLLDYEVWTLDDLVNPENDYFLFKTWFGLLEFKNLTSASGPSKTEELLTDIRVEQEEIGKKFYKVYREARLELLRDIYRNNPSVKENIDFGIEKAQKIIDRVVFACFAEDTGLLPDNTLHRVLKAAEGSTFGGSLWNTLKGFFEAIDVGSSKLEIPDGYNGGLFKLDSDLNNLKISDEPLKKVISLGSYDFGDDLSVTILGHIFEQSISDLEEIKSKVNESQNLEAIAHSRRKKDGIFYTPDYIVRYIVDNSLGLYLREHEEKFKEEFKLKGDINDENYEKRERQAYEKYQKFLEGVKVLDPACGSGAFLVYVFDYLMAENKRVANILGSGLFSTDQYIRSVLKNNIFGVDLNEESVEITKLSLWLKSAEKGKKLTSLDKNIKCGNSLIADPEIVGDKAFDWNKEFYDIMKSGGFDVIVMNPPYVKEAEGKEIFAGLHNNPDYQGKMDLWYLFGGLALGLVKKEVGVIGLIAPSNWVTNDGASKFRNKILSKAKIEKFIDFGDYKVFDQAGIQTMVMVLKNDASSDVFEVSYSKLLNSKAGNNDVTSFLNKVPGSDFVYFQANLNREQYTGKPIAFVDEADEMLLKKISEVGILHLLKDEVHSGIDIGQDYVNKKSKEKLGNGFDVGEGIFNITKKQYKETLFTNAEKTEILKPFYTTKEINRYKASNQNDTWVVYTKSDNDVANNPNYRNIKQHLDKYQSVITSANKPYGLHRARAEEIFKGEKIMSIRKCARPSFTYTDFDSYVNRTYLIIKTDRINLKYLCGILNSKVIEFWLQKMGKLQGDLLQVDIGPLTSVPVVESDDQKVIADLVTQLIETSTALENLSQRFLSLVVSDLKIKLPTRIGSWWTKSFEEFIANLSTYIDLPKRDELLTIFEKYRQECSSTEEKIVKTEEQINQIVYRLYNLNADEINHIEVYE